MSILNDGYPEVMTDEQITEALWHCPGGYSPEGVAVQRQIAALRAEVENTRRVMQAVIDGTREARDKAEDEVERLKADSCENGHHTHAECSEVCACSGQGKSRLDNGRKGARLPGF